jgi:hypothetical protein
VGCILFSCPTSNSLHILFQGVNDLSLIGALPCFCGILALAVAERSFPAGQQVLFAETLSVIEFLS